MQRIPRLQERRPDQGDYLLLAWRFLTSSDPDIVADASKVNLRRLQYMAFGAVLVSIVHIVVFGLFQPATSAVELRWRSGIIVSHLVIAAFMVVVGWFGGRFSKESGQQRWSAQLLQYGTATFILGMGVAIAAIDQLATTSIAPFLIACAIPALLLLIRPGVTLLLYLAAYAGFFGAMWMQADPAIRLSNQTNGLTVMGLGIVLSWTLWSTHARTVEQQKLIQEQQQTLQATNARLSYLAAYDELTGLCNRREFQRLVTKELQRMGRTHHPSCIMLIDIDFFKHINDTYGHPMGDRLLQSFGEHLQNELRVIDTVGRWGGEEFIVLLPETTLTESLQTAERLRAGIETKGFGPQRSLNITASFGVAPLRPYDTDGLQVAYRQADAAMYSAKQAGRNCVRPQMADV